MQPLRYDTPHDSLGNIIPPPYSIQDSYYWCCKVIRDNKICMQLAQNQNTAQCSTRVLSVLHLCSIRVLSGALSVPYPFISTVGNCNGRYYSAAMDQTVSISCVHATDEDFCNAGIASEPLSMNIISCVLRIQAMELLHPNSSPRYFPYSRNQTWSR